MMMDHHHHHHHHHHVTKQTSRTTTTTSRKSKQGNDKTQNKKTTRLPQRGKGVAYLERERVLKECVENMPEIPSLHPSQNGVVVQFPHHHHQLPLTTSHAASAAAPQMMFPPPGNYRPNVLMDNVVVHPNIGNPGYRFDNRNEMFSVQPPNYVKFGGSDVFGTTRYKKIRINMSGSNSNLLNTPNQHRYGMNNVIGKIDYAGKNLCFSPQQMREARSGYRVWTGGNGMPEYEFFPGKGGETTSSSWCVRSGGGGGGGTERGGMIGSHGGEGSSCVTAVTSNEEGSVCCSVDLSLKL